MCYFLHFYSRLKEPLCLGLCALTKLIKKSICAKFPGQIPFGILREDIEITALAESESLVAQDRLEPLCKGLCLKTAKLVYKTLWIAMWPVCQLKPPFGR